jgi:hypothetical protein
MSSPNCCAYSIACSVTWDPCPSKTNKCLLVREIPLGINLLKKDNHYLNKKLVIHAFDCIIMHVLVL